MKDKQVVYWRITKDFNSLPIVFREDGYTNMTKAAKHFRKHVGDSWRNEAIPRVAEMYLLALKPPRATL